MAPGQRASGKRPGAPQCYKGEIVAKPERVVPIQDMGQQDYIFICVKNYSLAEVCESIRDMVTDDTVIIPVMNGVDPGENIRRLVGKGTVVDSLIYTVAFANEDFSISHAGYVYVALYWNQRCG